MKKSLVKISTIVTCLSLFVSTAAYAGGPSTDIPVDEPSARCTATNTYYNYQNDTLNSYVKESLAYNFKKTALESFSTKIPEQAMILKLLSSNNFDEDFTLKQFELYFRNDNTSEIIKLASLVYDGNTYILDTNNNTLYILYRENNYGVIYNPEMVNMSLNIISRYTGKTSKVWKNNVKVTYDKDGIIVFNAGAMG